LQKSSTKKEQHKNQQYTA